MFALICGHTVCVECKTLLIQHDKLNVCPLCRLPLNWNGILQLYEGDQLEHINDDIIREIVEENQAAPRNEIHENNNANINVRDVRMHRERTRDFTYNMCASFISVFFVLVFWIAMTSK